MNDINGPLWTATLSDIPRRKVSPKARKKTTSCSLLTWFACSGHLYSIIYYLGYRISFYNICIFLCDNYLTILWYINVCLFVCSLHIFQPVTMNANYANWNNYIYKSAYLIILMMNVGCLSYLSFGRSCSRQGAEFAFACKTRRRSKSLRRRAWWGIGRPDVWRDSDGMIGGEIDSTVGNSRIWWR